MPKEYFEIKRFIEAANDELGACERRLTSDRTALAELRKILPLDEDESKYPVLTELAAEIRETEARVNELLSKRSKWYREISRMLPAPVI